MEKVIAIDGPSGSGKSTIAKIVADKLSLTYLDTGAMFRAIAYCMDKKNVEVENVDFIAAILKDMDFQYAPTESILVEIDGHDLTEKIREHHVSKLASMYSKVSIIRDFLKEKQREIARSKPSILEGRDIGTVIFPDAAIKIFLTADPEVRAKRRFEEIKDTTDITYEQVLSDIKKRDEADRGREIAPLVKADDAIEIDTSHKSLEDITQEITRIFESKKNLFY